VENQYLNSGRDKTPEEIQDEMAQTREAISEKVAALEHQVVGTVQTAADTISGTVDAVKSLVDTAPGAVNDTVKKAANIVSEKMSEVFDISRHIRDNPWGAVGLSAGLGFLTGLMVFRERDNGARAELHTTPHTPPRGLTPEVHTAAAHSGPGFLDDLTSMVGKKLREVAENVIDSASEAINRNVKDGVPKLVDAATEAATEKLGQETPLGGRLAGYRG
jgi:ElaB/YqjD/DUF883 family membrane-anchored ribosome-binding protein